VLAYPHAQRPTLAGAQIAGGAGRRTDRDANELITRPWRSRVALHLMRRRGRSAPAGDLGLGWIGEDGHEKRCRVAPAGFSDEAS
jgi:hypothetical protein